MSEQAQTEAGAAALQEYDVTITETLQKIVTVAAAGSHEAEQAVSDQWKNSEHVLDADNFVGVDFAAAPANRELARNEEQHSEGQHSEEQYSEEQHSEEQLSEEQLKEGQHSEGGTNDMNSGNASITQSGADAAALSDNKYVGELYNLLESNGKDTSGLTALLGYVSGMESLVKRAEGTFSDMQTQLESMKEIQNHPIKAALKNAVKSLEQKIADVKARLSELKGNIIEGCKNAVAAFKEKGIAALSNLASFFRIRSGLEDWKKNIDGIISDDDKAIAKIEKFSTEYHTAGRSLKNMALIAVGREPKTDIKEAGKLSKTFTAPYRAQKAVLVKLGNTIEKASKQLEQLETSQAERKAERAKARKSSVLERLADNKERVERDRREIQVPERAKAQGVEV